MKNRIASTVIKGSKRIRNASEKSTVNDWGFENLTPFTLQPLIENSIAHGLKDSMDGEIQIHVFNDESGCIFISIYDSGYGIDPDIVNDVIDGKLDSKGLGNVIKRLKLIYSNPDIILFSKQSQGTTINIHLEKTL